jgi:hypothetical protein
MVKKEVNEFFPYEVGKNYFIRTVTMNYTGKLVAVTPGELVLSDASWIADTGSRLMNFLKGEFNSNTEIEPFSSQVIVPRTSVIDATLWTVVLPREQR